jgi:hypothetical protein
VRLVVGRIVAVGLFQASDFLSSNMHLG